METCYLCANPAAYRNMMSGDYMCAELARIKVMEDPFKVLDLVSTAPDGPTPLNLFTLAHATRQATLTGIVTDVTVYNADTLQKVRSALAYNGINHTVATDVINSIQNLGILFRERK